MIINYSNVQFYASKIQNTDACRLYETFNVNGEHTLPTMKHLKKGFV